MSMQHLQEGLDPTPLACISVSNLLEMIRNAKPYPNQGFVIFADAAPDVVTNPELEYFLWMKTVAGVPNKEVYYYDGASWSLLPLIDGQYLAPGSITLDKFSLSGALPFDIIQVDVAGTALGFVSVPNAIQANTLDPVKLIAPDNTNTYILTCFLGVKAFEEISTVMSTRVADNSIPITKIVKGAADALGLYLRTKIDGSAIEWANVDVANIAAAGAAAKQGIRRNAGNTAWEFFDATNSPVVHGPSAMTDVGGADVSFAHGLGRAARSYKVVARCVNGATTAGYALNDEVDLAQFLSYTADGEICFPGFTIYSDATNLVAIPRGSAGLGEYIAVAHKSTGINTPVVVADWNIVAYILA